MPQEKHSGRDKPEAGAFFARAEGRVQGVGFRYACMREAQRFGLSGWVKNTPEGDVEVWAEGPEEKLDAMLRWLRRGPPGARVDTLRYEICAPTGQYREFGVRY